METAVQSSAQTPVQGLRSKITTIELAELSLLGFVLWCLLALLTIGSPDVTLTSLIVVLFMVEGGILGSWAIYNIYIRLARAGGKLVDVGLWVIAATLTASYTFWAWTILDVNRWIMSKLFYRGMAPVEYAWSAHSKAMRKAWEQGQQLAH